MAYAMGQMIIKVITEVNRKPGIAKFPFSMYQKAGYEFVALMYTILSVACRTRIQHFVAARIGNAN